MAEYTSNIDGADTFNLIKSIDYTLDRSDREFSDIFIARRPLSNPLSNTHTYIFFTAPSLPLDSKVFNDVSSGISVSEVMSKNGRYLKLPGFGDSIYSQNIIDMLTGSSGALMPLFTNRAMGIPASDIALDNIEYSETWNKYKIPIGTTSKDSQIGGNFDLPIMEDHNLTTLRSLKLWIDTIQGMFLGDVISASSCRTDIGSAQFANIDYSVAAYVFVTRADASTLIYWSKYTGVYPTKLAYSVFQTEDGSGTILDKVNAEFQFAYKEDMDIAILNDFNLTLLPDKNGITNFTGKRFFDNSVSLTPSTVNPSIHRLPIDQNGNPRYALKISETNDPMYPGGNTNYNSVR